MRVCACTCMCSSAISIRRRTRNEATEHVTVVCRISPSLIPRPPDFTFGLEHTGGLIIQTMSGDRRGEGGGGEGSGTFSITGKFLTSLASHFEEPITGMNKGGGGA